MNRMIVDVSALGDPAPMPKCRSEAQTIWKLVHRFCRLDQRAEAVRGERMNMAWLEVAGHIFACLELIESLGVNCSDRERDDYFLSLVELWGNLYYEKD